jgi:hypothetical protein
VCSKELQDISQVWWWLVPVIPATREVEMRRITVQSQTKSSGDTILVEKLTMVVHNCHLR